MNEISFCFCGESLKKAIILRHMTLESVAKTIGVNKNTLNRATNSKQINIDSLLRICNSLQVSPSDLFIPSYTTEQQPIHTAHEEDITYKSNPTAQPSQSIQAHYEMSQNEEIAMLRRLNENYLKQIKQLETMLREQKKRECKVKE